MPHCKDKKSLPLCHHAQIGYASFYGPSIFENIAQPLLSKISVISVSKSTVQYSIRHVPNMNQLYMKSLNFCNQDHSLKLLHCCGEALNIMDGQGCGTRKQNQKTPSSNILGFYKLVSSQHYDHLFVSKTLVLYASTSPLVKLAQHGLLNLILQQWFTKARIVAMFYKSSYWTSLHGNLFSFALNYKSPHPS